MHVGGSLLTVADLRRLPGAHQHIALVPQWDFLELLAAASAEEPTFTLRRNAEVTRLVHDRGRVVGVGLDEDTAAFLGPDDRLEVVGSGALTVVDPAGLAHSSMAAARGNEPVSLIGIKLHILANGDLFDVETREARAGRPAD